MPTESGHPPSDTSPRRHRRSSRRDPPSQVEVIPTTNALFWAARYSGVKTANERLVLVTLADCWNPNEHCTWPSHQRIADQSRLSKSAVKIALIGLRDQGTVDWREMHRKGHKGRDGSPNCYVFPLYDSRPPLPNEKFVLHATARPGRRTEEVQPSGSNPTGSAASSSSAVSKPKLRRHTAEAVAAGGYEVPRQVPLEVPSETGTTSDGLRRPTGRPPNIPVPLADARTTPAAQPTRSGERDGRLNPAAERGNTPHACAQRLKIILLAHPDVYVAPVNVKTLAATLSQWHKEGTSIEVIREMVDIFAARPKSYMPKDDIPWRGFINAREKLATDASKVTQAKNPTARYGKAAERTTDTTIVRSTKFGDGYTRAAAR